MFNKFTAKFGFALGCFFALFVLAALCSVSWLITCGLVYLVTLCFSLEFSWAVATGVWLVMILLRSIIGGASK